MGGGCWLADSHGKRSLGWALCLQCGLIFKLGFCVCYMQDVYVRVSNIPIAESIRDLRCAVQVLVAADARAEHWDNAERVLTMVACER